MVTDINICSRSLIRLGEGAIADFTANDKSVICGSIYPEFSKCLLSMHNWRFARKKANLNKASAPTNAYKNAYDLPGDYLTLVAAYNDEGDEAKSLIRDYERFGSQIFSNADNLIIDYIYDIAEDDWPFWYQEFVVTALAAELLRHLVMLWIIMAES